MAHDVDLSSPSLSHEPMTEEKDINVDSSRDSSLLSVSPPLSTPQSARRETPTPARHFSHTDSIRLENGEAEWLLPVIAYAAHPSSLAGDEGGSLAGLSLALSLVISAVGLVNSVRGGNGDLHRCIKSPTTTTLPLQ